MLYYYIGMRIISGRYKGKKLKEFELDSTKPTTDRVKESIFNLIQFDIIDAVVLDLFAGTGALGIECISRGAKKTTLVDVNSRAIKIIKDNLKGIEGEYLVVESDYIHYLENTRDKFDIILLDPPYATDYGLVAIEYIVTNDLLQNNGIIIFETALDHIFEFDHLGYDCKMKKYGNIAVYKITKLGEE